MIFLSIRHHVRRGFLTRPYFLSSYSGVGVVGAVVMLWFWWYSGIPLPGVIASGLVLGYLLACLVLSIPVIHRYLIETPTPGKCSKSPG